eukprot:1443465-Amphidinium_carterae.1
MEFHVRQHRRKESNTMYHVGDEKMTHFVFVSVVHTAQGASATKACIAHASLRTRICFQKTAKKGNREDPQDI